MLRNYLAAALRNLVRNRLYAAINIGGLAVGFAAALLIALFLRDEISYDSYFPDHERIYVLRYSLERPGMPTFSGDAAPPEFAKQLALEFSSIEKIGRFGPRRHSIRHGEIENMEYLLWADPQMLDILKFRPVAGDLSKALAMPDSIILTRAMARKYFGKDDAVGEHLELNRKNLLTVTAVIEDLPSNVNRPVTFIAAGQAANSPLAWADARPPEQQDGGSNFGIITYLKLPDRAAARHVAERLPDFLKRNTRQIPGYPRTPALELLPLSALHFAPTQEWPMTVPRGSMERLFAVSAIGLLIVVAAGINFVNLMTARAARRATEVGVRKVNGAARRQLVVQFIGELVVYVVISMALALALASTLLPALNTFLDRTINLDLLSDPRSLAFIAGLVPMVGVLAGLYPAFVLSAFRPAAVLKAGMIQPHASAVVRQSLVVLQFALLIGLLVSTAVIGRQIQFALTEAQRLDTDEVLIVPDTCDGGSFRDAVSALPGVRAAVCSEGATSRGEGRGFDIATGRDGAEILFEEKWIDPGFFEFYGVNPIAGRFFAADRPAYIANINRRDPVGDVIVLNETAVRRFGFESATAAVGQTLPYSTQLGSALEIIGVVPDYASTIQETIGAEVYYVSRGGYYGVLNVRLDGARIPETLAAIDKLWKQHGQPIPINRYFLSADIQARYADITRQGTLFAVFTSVAIVIALLGLFGMAAFTVEQRTKEIGIRKAMGASKADVVRLLLWQFAKPVLWANVIAWPVTAYLMRRWLEGFAYHVDLEPGVFLAAMGAALLIATLTVLGHALLVARTQPAAALRYE